MLNAKCVPTVGWPPFTWIEATSSSLGMICLPQRSAECAQPQPKQQFQFRLDKNYSLKIAEILVQSSLWRSFSNPIQKVLALKC